MSEEFALLRFMPDGHDHKSCMDEAIEAATAVCAERSLRLTPLRRRVLEMIWGQHEPVLAYGLLEQLRIERSRAAPTTVYRALDFLLANGLIHRIESLNAYVGCGQPRVPHMGQFLICADCNAIAELHDPDISQLVTRKAGSIGFNVDRQTIEVSGQCPDCRRAVSADEDAEPRKA